MAHHRLRILIVEDQDHKADAIHTTVLKVAPDVIMDRGRSIRCGLKLIEEKEFDLIFLDMGLPNFPPAADPTRFNMPHPMGGREILYHMREDERTTPVIVVSATDAIEDLKLQLDGFDFLLDTLQYASYTDAWRTRIHELMRTHLTCNWEKTKKAEETDAPPLEQAEQD